MSINNMGRSVIYDRIWCICQVNIVMAPFTVRRYLTRSVTWVLAAMVLHIWLV